ncbi:hypothetical protein EYF80_047340 [Liparis tanakae]|uniref:Uncharacterized protein n=1 Tax=Liparis tanakae TaxID=230148 RepID=A0A4Z2FNL3_9TELE|nr:hypothetical protein EYF80_047340 [Liparis tanakae]
MDKRTRGHEDSSGRRHEKYSDCNKHDDHRHNDHRDRRNDDCDKSGAVTPYIAEGQAQRCHTAGAKQAHLQHLSPSHPPTHLHSCHVDDERYDEPDEDREDDRPPVPVNKPLAKDFHV